MQTNEHLKNALLATTAAIPLVGGSMSIILDKYLPSELEKRKEDLLNSIINDIEEIKDKVAFEKLNNQEFFTTFLKVFKRAIEEHREEKILAFRNILVNEILQDSSKFDEVTLYLRLVEDLTIDQIRILQYVYKKQIVGHCSEGENLNIYQELQTIWPEVDKHYLQACVTELIRFFIISSSAEVLTKKGVKGHALTDFGERFLRHIFTPKES